MIYINGIKQPTITYSYYLNETYNVVDLIWNNSIIYCYRMFYGCSDITEMDLSNFNTSLVTNMGDMFYNCYSLSSLNLSTFNTSLVTKMNHMFCNCYNLKYINLINFIETSSLYVYKIFYSVPDNIVICINESSKIILPEIKNKKCYTIDCSDNWKIKQKKIINKKGRCKDNNNNDILYKYEYEGRYYENCLKGNLKNTLINNILY